jgi:dihydropteroate synthase
MSRVAARFEIERRRDAFLRLIGVKPVVMGILNVTPDSFSDGGRFQAPDAALGHAHKLVADGADIIDGGAESSRPGHATVPLRETFGLPILIGASRKRLLGDLTPSSIDDLMIGTLAANLVTLARGASVFRVHDAAEHAGAFKVFEAIEQA